jgi:Flp pilus assembly protein TadB
VYRLWRDLGYALGALLAGLVADALGLAAAIWAIAALTFVSGLIVAFRMSETLQRPGAMLSGALQSDAADAKAGSSGAGLRV